MKQLTSILLVAILAFNLFGYNIVFNIAESNAEKRITAKIVSNLYDDENLIRFEVPIYNPYQMDQDDFQYVMDEITIEDKVYKLVKRRVVDGKLELYCLYDDSKTPLLSARNEYFKKINDLENPNTTESKNSKSNVVKSGLSSEYESFSSVYLLAPLTAAENSATDNKTYAVLFRTIAHPGQPPELS